MRRKPHQPGGQAGEKKQPEAAQAGKTLPGPGEQKTPEARPVQYHHGQYGAKLNGHHEGFHGFLPGKAHEFAGQNEVPGG